jgi:hypothetical protein
MAFQEQKQFHGNILKEDLLKYKPARKQEGFHLLG